MLGTQLSTVLVVSCFLLLWAGSAHAKCQFSHGNYKLEWAVDRKNVVHFLLTYCDYPAGANSWTGVAFGEGMMYGLDAVIVRNTNGQITISDEFVQGYGPSSPDQSQDVKLKSAKVENGVLKVQFSRPADTPDGRFDLPLSGCKPWQFVHSVNHMFGSHTGKHSETPIGKRVCLKECALRR